MPKKKEEQTPEQETPETEQAEQKPEAAVEEPPAPAEPEVDWKKKYEAEHDSYLRVYADYDNYRKRTTKEKEQSYANGKADTLAKLLPVYDNLERALNQETADAAYKKGVEMTMNELVKIFTGLGVEVFGKPGDAFDPAMHNAVMHVEDENLGAVSYTHLRAHET